jgi:DNA-binding NtrC family response regulator
MRLLVIEDDTNAAMLLKNALSLEGHETGAVHSAEDAASLMDESTYDLVVCDVELPGMSGIEFAKSRLCVPASSSGRPAAGGASPPSRTPPAFILVSGQDRIIETVNALELGIEDFLPKPLNLKRLAGIIRRVERQRATRPMGQSASFAKTLASRPIVEIAALENAPSFLPDGEAPFLGVYGPAMAAVCDKIRKLLPYPEIPILLEGETGTGKELAARYAGVIDQTSTGPFIALNCSLFNTELFSAELFGYDRGAFTGANLHGKEGKLDIAKGGILFLDEVAEMSPELQAKFLRVLQERAFYRVGGNSLLPVNCRFLLATNRDIREAVSDGRFREDLFFRISTCHVHIPPLRQRRDEIVPLAVRFLKEIKDRRITATFVETAAFALLEDCPWPGNARQLQNLIFTWGIYETGDTLRAESLNKILLGTGEGVREGSRLARGVSFSPDSFVLPDEPFKLADLEKAIALKTLAKFGGNKTKTADFLGISRSQFYDKFCKDQ